MRTFFNVPFGCYKWITTWCYLSCLLSGAWFDGGLERPPMMMAIHALSGMSLPGTLERQQGCRLLDGCVYKWQFPVDFRWPPWGDSNTEESKDTLWTHGHHICCASGDVPRNATNILTRASSQAVCYIGLNWEISEQRKNAIEALSLCSAWGIAAN